MFVNKYAYIFNKISSPFAYLDFELVKYLFFALLLLAVSLVFGVRIVSALEEGYKIEKKLDSLKNQVTKLEEENILLKKEKDFITSKEALELEYRNLGYAKIDEEIFFVDYLESDNSNDYPKKAEQISKQNNKDKEENWKEWLLLLFK